MIGPLKCGGHFIGGILAICSADSLGKRLSGVGDLMDFFWDDTRHLHPSWPSQPGQLPTIVIPSSQKNKRVQGIPLLPGLKNSEFGAEEQACRLDRQSPADPIRDQGWSRLVPAPGRRPSSLHTEVQQPVDCKSMRSLETTVRKWLKKLDSQRDAEFQKDTGEIPLAEVTKLRNALNVKRGILPSGRMSGFRRNTSVV